MAPTWPELPLRDERECADYLADRRWPHGFVCPRCDHAGQAYRVSSRPRLFECRSCHHQTSVTAGTILHRSKLAIHDWLTAAWLMCRPGGISAARLSRELGLRYETVWRLCHKIRAAMGDDFEPILTGSVSVGLSFGKVRRPHRNHRPYARGIGIVTIASPDGAVIDPHIFGEAKEVTILHRMFSSYDAPSRRAGAHAAADIRQTLGSTFREVSRHWLRRYLGEIQHRTNYLGPLLEEGLLERLLERAWSPWKSLIPAW